MSPHCVWLVIVGGGVKKPMNTFITESNKLMIIELGKIIIAV